MVDTEEGMQRELQGSEEFHEALRDELQVSHDYGLILCALWVRFPEDLDAETTRRLLGGIRAVDLATATSEREVAIILPNTSPESARIVTERLLASLPEAEAAQASYEPGDTPESLFERARGDLEG